MKDTQSAFGAPDNLGESERVEDRVPEGFCPLEKTFGMEDLGLKEIEPPKASVVHAKSFGQGAEA